MKEKISITENEKNEIYQKFKTGISLRKLEKEYPYSFTFIQKLVNSYEFENKLNSNYKKKDGYSIVAICKITKKVFNDYKNQSGALTNHIQLLYNVSIPSNYKRKSIEYNTGKFWYDKYFYFDYQKIKQLKKCKLCEWSTEDIENKSGAYEKHLKLYHNLNLNEYISRFPEEKKYFKKEIYDNLIPCMICGKKFKSISNTHLLNKHGITLNDYKLKFGINSIIVSNTTSNKLSKIAIETNKNMCFSKTSIAENEILDTLNKYSLTIKQSTRKSLGGLEIDLYFPEQDLGIEYNGNYYHTEIRGGKNRSYHLNKSKLAREKNINLYHIFEDEWIYKKNIVINKLKHILNINDNKTILHARKCIITKKITTKEKQTFLENNHIQGNTKSVICVGAKFNDELVALMCFDDKRNMNKSQNHNTNTYELTRFAVKNEYIISGIASRLLKYFIKLYNPIKILSFADRRWTPNPDDNIYIKLGFKLTKILKPEYYYFNQKIDRLKRFHKFGFGKSSLKKKFPEIYDENKTEWEIMQELGFDRIWDCGKYKYELDI